MRKRFHRRPGKLIQSKTLTDSSTKEYDVIAVNSKGIEWAGKELSKYYKTDIPILLLTKGLTLIENKFATLAEKLKLILEKNGTKSKINFPCNF